MRISCRGSGNRKQSRSCLNHNNPYGSLYDLHVQTFVIGNRTCDRDIIQLWPLRWRVWSVLFNYNFLMYRQSILSFFAYLEPYFYIICYKLINILRFFWRIMCMNLLFRVCTIVRFIIHFIAWSLFDPIRLY